MQKLLRINYITFFVLLLTLGVNVLVFNEKLYKFTVVLILIVLLIDSLRQLIKLIVKKEITFLNSLIIIGTVIAIAIMLNYKNIPYSFFPIVLGAYTILNGIVKFIYSLILFENKFKGRYINILIAMLFFTIGIILVFSPLMHLKVALCFVGVYLILLSLNYLYEYYKDVKHIEKTNLRRNLRVPLPSIIEAFLPYAFLKQIDENVKLYENKTGEEPDLEILIHVTETGDGRLGHIDLYYNNIVYSYGNYDPATRKLHMCVGDGVLLKSEKKKYIEFCINDADKTLFGYGIKLNDIQKEAVKKAIDKMEEKLVTYTPKGYPKAYGERLKKYTKAKFYKFNKGKFIKYILLGRNCAHFIDSIIGKTGSDILKINGLMNPGTYYEYLENEFNKKNSIVISRTIYNKNSLKNL
ncbi:MAG: hypothetical protein IKN87_03315 [Bacilli bacterium]|nr:hypothetical protein [Bacilli bacterium]